MENSSEGCVRDRITLCVGRFIHSTCTVLPLVAAEAGCLRALSFSLNKVESALCPIGEMTSIKIMLS